MTTPWHQSLPVEPELEGDPALLQECLGSPGGLGTLGPAVWSAKPQPVTDAGSLQRLVERYRESVLLPLELPAIRGAFLHASRYEVRELIQLDRELSRQSKLLEFAFASQAVGRAFLRRLRPLRDVRLLRRYEQAVHEGKADGWHTLVYGTVLSVYSLPLRQGLLGYARQTLNGFLEAGAGHLQLTVRELRQLQDSVLTPLPQRLQDLGTASLRCLPPRPHGASEPR